MEKNITKIWNNTKVKKIRKKLGAVLINATIFFALVGVKTIAYASGAGDPTATWNTGVDLIQKIVNVLAIGLIVIGVIEFFYSMYQNDPSGKTSGVKLAVAGIGIGLVSVTLIPNMKM